MRRASALLLFGLPLTIGAPVYAAGPPPPPPPPPVVATWFSNLAPKVGSHEALYVQVTKAGKPVSGGKMTATVTYGKGAIHLRGTTTNTQGRAWAKFTVPSNAKGAILQASTAVSVNGHTYRGSNHVTVKK